MGDAAILLVNEGDENRGAAEKTKIERGRPFKTPVFRVTEARIKIRRVRVLRSFKGIQP